MQELESATAEEPSGEEFTESPYGAARYEALLALSEPVTGIESGPSYCFPEQLGRSDAVLISDPDRLKAHLPEWREDVAIGQPMYGVIVEGEIVSLCASVRITAVAHEAGVETAVAFRGKGYAARAVVAWARAVRTLGRIPLYSTSWQNERSRALAAKLGLIRYGTTLHIT
jgi:RimJ/RimL family protein N-acetyltransferase